MMIVCVASQSEFCNQMQVAVAVIEPAEVMPWFLVVVLEDWLVHLVRNCNFSFLLDQ